MRGVFSFNHPMVKVKELKTYDGYKEENSFNHPMVKVKANARKFKRWVTSFQPPYGES